MEYQCIYCEYRHASKHVIEEHTEQKHTGRVGSGESLRETVHRITGH